MFKFLKNWKSTPTTAVPSAESESIAAPKGDVFNAYPTSTIPPTFAPIDMITTAQSIPGKFNYTSSTWKYIENYFKARTVELHRRNENPTLAIEKTQLIRGQLKEINLLLNHINQVTGITPPPTKSVLDQSSTARGRNYE